MQNSPLCPDLQIDNHRGRGNLEDSFFVSQRCQLVPRTCGAGVQSLGLGVANELRIRGWKYPLAKYSAFNRNTCEESPNSNEQLVDVGLALFEIGIYDRGAVCGEGFRGRGVGHGKVEIGAFTRKNIEREVLGEPVGSRGRGRRDRDDRC